MLLSWLEIICGSHSFVSLTITDGKHMIAELTGQLSQATEYLCTGAMLF